MRIAKAFCGLLFSVFLTLSPSWAGPSDRNLLFLGNQRLPPLLFSKNGEARGLIVDIARAMADRAGLNIEVEVLEWPEAQAKVLHGEADGLLQVNRTEEREPMYDFSVPLFRSDFTIFRRLDRIDIIDVTSLRGHTVGVEAMGLPLSVLRDEPEISIRYIASWQEGFKLVRSGEIDAIVVDRWIGEYELFLSGFDDIVPIHKPIQNGYTYVAVQKGNRALLEKINDGLTEIKSDGTVDKIVAQWCGKKIVYLSEAKMKFYYVIATMAVINVFLLALLASYAWLLRKAKKETERLARTDGLTNLLNRRSFYDKSKVQLSEAQRSGTPVSIVQIDVDSFKGVNDTWGHQFGDTVLVEVSNCIARHTGKGDLCARIGGDEFTIFLRSDREKTELIAERIRLAVGELELRSNGQDVKVSISVGVASDEEGASSLEELVYRADQALYRAKRAGRDQVRS